MQDDVVGLAIPKDRNFWADPRSQLNDSGSKSPKIFSNSPVGRMSTNLFFRVSVPYDSIASLLASVFMQCKEYAVVEHEADDDDSDGETINRTHVHVLIGGYTKTRESLRLLLNTIKTPDNLSGNSLKSIKEWTDLAEIKPLVYMLKGHLKFKVLHGFDRFVARAQSNGYLDLIPYLWDLWTDKISKAEKQFRECFAGWQPRQPTDEEVSQPKYNFYEFIRKQVDERASDYAFIHTGYIWSGKTENLHVMLWKTYMGRRRLKKL